MKNLMMVGRILEKEQFVKARLVDVISKEVLDLGKDEIAKLLKDEEVRILNLKLNSNDEVICPHNIDRYGIVGKSNAFVVLLKKIVDASNINGIIFEIADTNGFVKSYYQTEATELDGFYKFANVRVDTVNRKINAMADSLIYVKESMNAEEREVKAISFVKELQRSKIDVVYHKIPFKHESPRDFGVKSLGRVGRIETAPGTEGFNKNILEALNFNNTIADSNCKFIQPTHGYTDSFIGWKTNSNQVTELPNPEFTIDYISTYGDDFLNDDTYKKSDYSYCVDVKFLNTYVYVLKNSKIGKVRVMKQN